ncbi:MAG: molecular chaperone DnaJ [Hyphomonadaceae bacterium]|nr:MAG: molecular chaperone DnaJ [Hyphomonadaceae bacterium]KAF0184693.1 MAG: molecular chaperone DnaJ [Hyphomonadaceae bacterium]
MTTTCYYELLEVTRDANDATIKSAFRKAAMKHHPDKNPGDAGAEAKFKEINEAYSVLSDSQKRATYDRYGRDGLNNMGGRGGFSGDPSDIFGEVFGDIFGEVFGGGRQRRQGPARGADLRMDLEITLEEAFRGVDREIKVPTEETCVTCDGSGAEPPTKPETCPTCLGSGQVRAQNGFFQMTRTCHHCNGRGTIIAKPCKKCKGQGAIEIERTLSVAIPAGVEQDTRVRLTGEGGRGARGGPKGDLYVFLHVKKHEIFERDGRDLFIRIPVPMTKAALGGKLEVPVIDGGKQEVEVPEGSQTGRRIKLRAQGMTQLRSALRGDMHVELYVETPRKLTARQRELLEEFHKECCEQSHPEHQGFFEKAKVFWENLAK